MTTHDVDQVDQAVTTAKSQPVDEDGQLILWDNLLATLVGTLEEVADWAFRILLPEANCSEDPRG